MTITPAVPIVDDVARHVPPPFTRSLAEALAAKSRGHASVVDQVLPLDALAATTTAPVRSRRP